METAHGLVNSRNKHQQSIWLARKTQKTKQYFTNLKWRFFAGCSWFPMVSLPKASPKPTVRPRRFTCGQLQPWSLCRQRAWMALWGFQWKIVLQWDLHHWIYCIAIWWRSNIIAISIWIYCIAIYHGISSLDLLYITISSLHPEPLDGILNWPNCGLQKLPLPRAAVPCVGSWKLLWCSLRWMDGWMDR